MNKVLGVVVCAASVQVHHRQHDDDGHGVSCVAVAAGGRFLPFFVVLRTAANQALLGCFYMCVVFPFF